MSYWRAAMQGNLNDIVAVEQEIAAKAITSAVRNAASLTQNAMQKQTRNALFGLSGSQAFRDHFWKMDSAPKGRQASMRAAAWVYAASKRIAAALSVDAVVTGSGMILIPTKDAIEAGLDKTMAMSKGPNPRRYFDEADLKARFGGRVWTAKSESGIPLLMVMYRGKPFPLAIIVPQIRLRKMFDLDATAEKYREQLGLYITRAWNRAERPKKPGGVTVTVDG